MYTYDSRKVKTGDTFICLPGGDPYISDAQKNGAVAVQKMSRAEMAQLANHHFGQPSQQLMVIGVTGTNGKTTVVSLVQQCLNNLGFHCECSGTLTSSLTTPESLDLQARMADHVANGGTHFVMEVSSHGIAQHRVNEVAFDIKALTNLGQDHLDFHGSIQNYHQTKTEFLNTGDAKSVTQESVSDISIPSVCQHWPQFHQENIQIVIGILYECGLTDTQLEPVYAKLRLPEGRFEEICLGQPYSVIIDFAHTPGGLERALMEAKKMAHQQQGQLTVVFGCGGEREREKRPLMGRIAQQIADTVILTLDNPRSESPDQIQSDILAGIKSAENVTRKDCRQSAIQYAIHGAKDNDVILIAGKGHESYQILKEKKQAFNDREVASKQIKERHGYFN